MQVSRPWGQQAMGAIFGAQSNYIGTGTGRAGCCHRTCVDHEGCTLLVRPLCWLKHSYTKERALCLHEGVTSCFGNGGVALKHVLYSAGQLLTRVKVGHDVPNT